MNMFKATIPQSRLTMCFESRLYHPDNCILRQLAQVLSPLLSKQRPEPRLSFGSRTPRVLFHDKCVSRYSSTSLQTQPFRTFSTCSQRISAVHRNRSIFTLASRYNIKKPESDEAMAKSEDDVDNDPDLTEEERQVLKEIIEEERRYKEQMDADDFSVWDGPTTKDGTVNDVRLAGSISRGHVPFADQQRVIQDVIDEKWNPLPEEEPEEIVQQLYPRGETGIFDIGELVDLLREEKAEEVTVITIPQEMDYADYMVISTVRHKKQLLALATYVRKMCKMKELKETDTLPFFDRSRDYNGWIALDLDNIILHIFLQEPRDYFDLETLWTVGPRFDDLSNLPDTEIVKLLNSIT